MKELAKRVATEIMEWEWTCLSTKPAEDVDVTGFVWMKDGTIVAPWNWNPAEQIADAWLVLKKVTETKQLSIWTKSNGKISISNTTSEMLPLWGWDFTDDFFTINEEAPLAICLAALKAKGELR